jgi:Gliding motility associated protein GldN
MAKFTSIKYPLSILAFLWLPVLVYSQKEEKVGYVNDVRCLYSLENGQMNGAYTSFYANGKKKAEGQFRHNTRIGKWTIWDSTGAMVHQRLYENNAYDYSVLFHKTERDKSFSSEKQINLLRDTNGLPSFPKVVEKEIVHSVVYWRMVSNKKQNPALFENNVFFNWLTQSILEGKIRAYSATNDKFKNRLTPEELKRTMDSLDVELVGFRIKEMRYYTSSHQISNTVILGLAPIIRSKKLGTNASNSPLFWIYMPNSRKEFAQNPLPNLGFPEDIKSYDDLFFNRCFSSTIIKESNVKNRSFDDYLNENEAYNAAQKIEMDIIDFEHNVWVYKPEAYARN